MFSCYKDPNLIRIDILQVRVSVRSHATHLLHVLLRVRGLLLRIYKVVAWRGTQEHILNARLLTSSLSLAAIDLCEAETSFTPVYKSRELA